MKGFIIIAVVVAIIGGLLLTLRTSRNAGTPSREVLTVPRSGRGRRPRRRRTS